MNEDVTELCRELYQNVLSSYENAQKCATNFSKELQSHINESEKRLHALFIKQEQHYTTAIESSSINVQEKLTQDQTVFNSNDLSEEEEDDDVELVNDVNTTKHHSVEIQNESYEVITFNRTVTNTLKRTVASTEVQELYGTKRRRHFSVDDRHNYLSMEHSDKRELIENLSQSSKSKKFKNAMKSRHSALRRTIAARIELPEIEEEDQQVEERNINPEMYAKNNLWRTLCVLCNKNERSLVLHYVRQHPESEVLIARPSPNMAKRLRDQIDPFNMANMKITGICYFCEVLKCMSKSHWLNHYLTHTGEELYYCKDCEKSAKIKGDHENCPNGPQNIYFGNSTDGSLMAYMCIECNYLQIRHDRIVQHVVNQHQRDETDMDNHYEKVTLVPDMSPIKSNLGMLDEPTKRYRCTICSKRSKNNQEFVEHFDNAHPNMEEYKCICGHLIDDEPITGNLIADHLKLHDMKDLYQCKICDDVFVEKSKVKNHLCYDHGDCHFKYHHIHRGSQKKITISEITLKAIHCKACEVEIDGAFIGVLKHLEIKHESEKEDLFGISSIKETNLAVKAANIKTSYTGNNEIEITI